MFCTNNDESVNGIWIDQLVIVNLVVTELYVDYII